MAKKREFSSELSSLLASLSPALRLRFVCACASLGEEAALVCQGS